MNLKNAVALVTGGSDGLGLSVAKALVAKEVQTHIVSRSQENLDKAMASINSPLLHTHQGDVTDFQAMEALAQEIGQIDILVNNAGLWLEGELVDNSVGAISKTIDVNLKGVIYSTKAVLPGMLARDEGFIFNISSTSGLKGRYEQSVYVASKFGVRGFTESLEEDLASTNIKVAGFYPGGMRTALFAKAGNAKENQDWMDTDKVAEIIMFMLEQDDTLLINHLVVNKRKVKVANVT